MEIIIHELGYKLAPYASGLCYEIWEYLPERVVKRGPHTGTTAPAGWKSIDCYPSTLEAGVKKIYDLSVNRDTALLTDIRDCIAPMKAIGDAIIRAVSQAEATHAKAKKCSNCTCGSAKSDVNGDSPCRGGECEGES